MRDLVSWARAMARGHVERAAGRVAAAGGERGLEASREGGRVTFAGRGLALRMIEDASLRELRLEARR